MVSCSTGNEAGIERELILIESRSDLVCWLRRDGDGSGGVYDLERRDMLAPVIDKHRDIIHRVLDCLRRHRWGEECEAVRRTCHAICQSSTFNTIIIITSYTHQDKSSKSPPHHSSSTL